MVKAFDFEDSGRTFTCKVEEPRGARTEAWWWFSVSGDANRYAPFQARSGDTKESVRARIAEYYTQLLFRRSQPAQPRQHWARRSKETTAPAVPEAAGPETSG